MKIFELVPNSSGEEELSFKDWNIIYVFYALVWVLSIYLQYFEYKRGLPHVWYCHYLFWSLSIFQNTIQFALILSWNKDYEHEVQIFILCIIAIIDTSFLSLLGFIYRRDFPVQRRNYLPPLL